MVLSVNVVITLNILTFDTGLNLDPLFLLSLRVRVYDLRSGSSVVSLYAHHLGVTAVQADDWKIVSGGGEGLVCVWEMRMTAKLWEMHNR